MNRTRSTRMHIREDHRSLLAYWTIIFMHDNPLFNIFKNAEKRLRDSGIKEGQRVLEVGCGPGFYTIPAAKIVGEEGKVYAMDLHPGFIRRVQKKADRKGLKNIAAIEGNASGTVFADNSMDAAFLYGLGHISGGLKDLVEEMGRIIKPQGTVAYEKGRGHRKGTLEIFEKAGFFLKENRERIMIFEKIQ